MIWLTKNKILEKVKGLIDDGVNLRKIYKTDFSLYRSATFHFGTWNKMLATIDEKYAKKYQNKENSVKKKDRNYTATSTLEALIERRENNLPMSPVKIISDDGSLYRSCRKFYGSYENAIISCGWIYSEIIEDNALMALYGHLFEEIVGRVFEDLNINYKKGYNTSLRPDFVIHDGEWIDAKLSDFTVFTSDTMEKYEPYCDKLTIIYLRGDKNREESISTKTTMISIFKVINRLSDEIKNNYIIELEKLWSLSDNQEALTAEIKRLKKKNITKQYKDSKKAKKVKKDKEAKKIKKIRIKKITNYQLQQNSPVKGAYQQPNPNRWLSKICVNGKDIHLGVFNSKNEAARAYDRYIINNNLNRRLNFLD